MVQEMVLIKEVVSPVLKKEKAYLCAIPTKPKTPTKEKEQIKKHDLMLHPQYNIHRRKTKELLTWQLTQPRSRQEVTRLQFNLAIVLCVEGDLNIVFLDC
jgi:hypothetical protein